MIASGAVDRGHRATSGRATRSRCARRNFYGTDGDRNVTPYHQTVEDNIIHRVIVDELEQSRRTTEARRGGRSPSTRRVRS